MRRSEGAGVKNIISLLASIAKRSGRETVRSYVDGLTDVELADAMAAASASDVAAGGTGDLFYESAAARLRGIDVETFGSSSNKKAR